MNQAVANLIRSILILCNFWAKISWGRIDDMDVLERRYMPEVEKFEHDVRPMEIGKAVDVVKEEEQRDDIQGDRVRRIMQVGEVVKDSGTGKILGKLREDWVQDDFSKAGAEQRANKHIVEDIPPQNLHIHEHIGGGSEGNQYQQIQKFGNNPITSSILQRQSTNNLTMVNFSTMQLGYQSKYSANSDNKSLNNISGKLLNFDPQAPGGKNSSFGGNAYSNQFIRVPNGNDSVSPFLGIQLARNFSDNSDYLMARIPLKTKQSNKNFSAIVGNNNEDWRILISNKYPLQPPFRDPNVVESIRLHAI